MEVSLKEFLDSKEDKREIEVTFSQESLDVSGNTCQYNDKDSSVSLQLMKEGDRGISYSGSGRMSFTGECSRCLEDVDFSIEFDYSGEVSVSDGRLMIPETSDEGESYLSSDGVLDMDALLSGEIYLRWPMKLLCKEDCKGLCPVCGTNLNKSTCSCDTFVPDPRMAVISDIFQGKNS